MNSSRFPHFKLKKARSSFYNQLTRMISHIFTSLRVPRRSLQTVKEKRSNQLANLRLTQAEADILSRAWQQIYRKWLPNVCQQLLLQESLKFRDRVHQWFQRANSTSSMISLSANSAAGKRILSSRWTTRTNLKCLKTN